MVEGSLDEPATVKVNGEPARRPTTMEFEATIQATPGVNQFTVEATDGTGNTRTNTYQVAVSGASASYSYDPAGNLLSREEGGQTWTYTWNALNELKTVSRDGVLVAAFAYDPLGRRVEKEAPAPGGVVTTSWAYDGLDMLRERVESMGATTSALFVHGPGVDSPLSKEGASGVEYFHADGLGSIVKITNTSGGVAHAYRYDAWGNIEAGGERGGFAFTGREWDPETGLYYYRARYYDPTAGRFISEDPIGFGGGANFYGYASGNPSRYVDPLGLFLSGQHWGMTINAMAAEGFVYEREASRFAGDVSGVDYRPYSNKPRNAAWHAMREKTTPPVSDAEAARRFEDYVKERTLAGDFEAALHAIQDSYAGGHKGFQEYDGIPSLKHLGQDDVMPWDPTYLAAYWATRQYIHEHVDEIRRRLKEKGYCK